MPTPDNILIVHKGALGDFICAWPAFAALRSIFPSAALHAYVPAHHHEFLTPLGILPASSTQRNILDTLYTASLWPAELHEWHVVWFGLRSCPFGETIKNSGHLTWLSGLGPDALLNPRQAYLQGIYRLESTPKNGFDAQKAWKDAGLPSWNPSACDTRALLFPGAGHRLKAWPVVQFFQLAQLLDARGLAPHFVLGPAELERGPHPKDMAPWPVIAPPSPLALARLLAQSATAVANDSGPMHLASMVGAPGVALFGPTSRRQWAPPGIRALAADTACRPCSKDTSNIQCPQARCMEQITPQQVAREVESVLRLNQ